MHRALSSTPNTTKKKKEKTNKINRWPPTGIYLGIKIHVNLARGSPYVEKNVDPWFALLLFIWFSPNHWKYIIIIEILQRGWVW
jgi:hypothetical protein